MHRVQCYGGGVTLREQTHRLRVLAVEVVQRGEVVIEQDAASGRNTGPELSGLRRRIRWRFLAWGLFAGRAFCYGVLVRLILAGQDLGQRADGEFELG